MDDEKIKDIVDDILTNWIIKFLWFILIILLLWLAYELGYQSGLLS